MGSLPHFLTHGAPLRASRARAPPKIPGARFNGKVYLAKLSSFLEILENAVPFATGSCPKIQTGRFGWIERAQNSGLENIFPELRLPSKLHKTVPFNENGRDSPETVIKIGFEEMEHKYLYHSVKMFRCPLKFSTRATRKLVPYVRTSKTHGVT